MRFHEEKTLVIMAVLDLASGRLMDSLAGSWKNLAMQRTSKECFFPSGRVGSMAWILVTHAGCVFVMRRCRLIQGFE